MDEKKAITLEMIKGIWPVAAILFGLGMTWTSLNSKIDTVIIAQKETNDVAKTLTVIVGKHDTSIAVLQNRVDACYNFCSANKPVSAAPSSTPTAEAPTKSTSVASRSESKPTNVSVRSEAKSEAKSEPKTEEKDEDSGLINLVEDATGINL